MAELSPIRVSADPRIELRDVGNGEKYAIVDDFLEDPDSIVANIAAYAAKYFTTPTAHPRRGPYIPDELLDEVRRFIRSKMSRMFPFQRAGLDINAFISNVSQKPEELSAYHRMCHIDPKIAPDIASYAGVLYLFRNPELGGTGFYRWNAEAVAERAFELGKESNEKALEYLRENSAYYRQPPQYMTDSNDIADLLTVAEPRYNRFIFYNGEIPHSLYITRPELLSEDPLKGRLTLNVFAFVRPSGATL